MGQFVSGSANSLSITAGAQSGLSEEDDRILRGLRAGIEGAYEELIDRYQQPVYSIVYRLGSGADASDVAQEVFLKIFRNVGSFQEKSSLRTWIFRIAVNEAHNHRRWFARHCKREVAIEKSEDDHTYSLEHAPDPGRSPFDQALDSETRALIERALAEINPVFRTAVVLRDMENLSYEEIAEILQVSLGTVKSRILRGREALRRELSQKLEQGLAQAFG
jgi:RNA polymerase sigma-70 factor, ECF subfamily